MEFVPIKSILLFELFSADKRKNPPVLCPIPIISFVDCVPVFVGIDKLFATEFEISFILGLSMVKSEELYNIFSKIQMIVF